MTAAHQGAVITGLGTFTPLGRIAIALNNSPI